MNPTSPKADAEHLVEEKEEARKLAEILEVVAASTQSLFHRLTLPRNLQKTGWRSMTTNEAIAGLRGEIEELEDTLDRVQRILDEKPEAVPLREVRLELALRAVEEEGNDVAAYLAFLVDPKRKADLQ